jgi:hypothetical protein
MSTFFCSWQIQSYMQLMAIVLIEFKHQGSTAEKSSVQKFNQGMCTDALNIIRA